MSATPRTDAIYAMAYQLTAEHLWHKLGKLAETLERELAAAIAQRDEARHQYAEAIMDAGAARIERDSARMKLDLAKKEWIEWPGGDCPVDDRTPVWLRFRDGEERLTQWPDDWWWSHDHGDADIVAYRLADSP